MADGTANKDFGVKKKLYERVGVGVQSSIFPGFGWVTKQS